MHLLILIFLLQKLPVMKKCTRLFLLMAFYALFISESCTDNAPYRTIKKPLFNNTITLFADSIQISCPITVSHWKVSDDKMLILSPQNRDNFLYAFSLPDFKLIYKYGVYGPGPDDFIAANWVNMSHENQLGLYDIPKMKMYTYDITTDTLVINKMFNFSKWRNNVCRPYAGIRQLNDSTFFLRADLGKEVEIEMVNINTGQVLRVFSNLLEHQLTESTATYSFDMLTVGNWLILYYLCVDRLEFFSINNDEITPSLVVGSDEDQHNVTSIYDYAIYYTDVKCDDHYVYALYQEGEKLSNIRSSSIEIYQEDGSPVAKLVLDRYIISFALDTKRNFIYGYSPDNSFDYVYKYTFNFNEFAAAHKF
jgi:hypothetical protein